MKMKKYIEITPSQLMCMVCKAKSGYARTKTDRKLEKIYKAITKNPEIPLMLVCSVSGSYSYQNPERKSNASESQLFNRKKNLDILRFMGLFPGAIMPGRFLIEKLIKSVESSKICEGKNYSKIWKGCKYAKSGNYEKIREKGIGFIIPYRSIEERKKAKKLSVEKMYNSRILMIRPHHLMCMACFSASERRDAPIEEDNLFEAVDIIRKNPEIPVKLIEGPCMICPPCSAYIPEKNICVGGLSMSLRDEKKDLDVLYKLDMEYGMVLPARELFRKLFEKIKSAKEICGFEDGKVTSPEWSVCGNVYKNYYEKARKEGMKIPGLKIKF